MTVRVTASAPGKIVLSGEYAVLDGAPAIAMAVNRRAWVTVTDIDGDVHRVSAPGYSDVEGLFEGTPDGIVWSQGEKEYRLLDAVWRAVGMEATNGKRIVLDSTGFVDTATQRKTGIGASAAVAVALCAALTRQDDVTAMARRAHTEVQDGMGSGVDIACSSRGGLIEYRMAGSAADTLQWPAGLLFQVIWSGVTVSTAAKLKRFSQSAGKPSRGRLAAAAAELAVAWRTGDARSIVANYRDYHHVLQSFSVDHKLGIFDAGHGELADAAMNKGLVYKPCGAGGGDVGIVLGTDAAKLAAFVNEQIRLYKPLACELDERGASIEMTGTKQE